MDTINLPQDVLAKLFATLKSWADGMDAFRYQMFASRLVAAEYGRPDAVEWAQAWYNGIIKEERLVVEAEARNLEERMARDAVSKAEFQAGRCGNPNYQAFLDTVQHPELIENNAPYFAWISPIIAKFERIPKLADLPTEERHRLWRELLQAERDVNLAPRLKAPLTATCASGTDDLVQKGQKWD